MQTVNHLKYLWSDLEFPNHHCFPERVVNVGCGSGEDFSIESGQKRLQHPDSFIAATTFPEVSVV